IQEFTVSPSIITVQAPHSPSPQPSLTPVNFNSSLRRSNSLNSSLLSKLYSLSFILRFIFMIIRPHQYSLSHPLRLSMKVLLLPPIYKEKKPFHLVFCTFLLEVLE